jgi:hypothetical protein
MSRASWRVRLDRLRVAPFQAWLAAAAVLTSITFLFDPDALRSVGMTYHPWDYVWNVGYGLGGLLVLGGLLALRNRIEVIGLGLLAWAFAVQVIAVSLIRGVPGAPTIAVFGLVVVACISRVHTLVSGYDAALVQYAEPKSKGPTP